MVIKCNSFFFLVRHQVKNAGRKLGRRCDMCSNYEKQLQAIQGQEAETRDQVFLRRLLFTTKIDNWFLWKHDRKYLKMSSR